MKKLICIIVSCILLNGCFSVRTNAAELLDDLTNLVDTTTAAADLVSAIDDASNNITGQVGDNDILNQVQNDISNADNILDVEKLMEELTATLNSATAAAGVIDNNASEFKGHYYAKIDKDMDWDEAREYCYSIGGHLAVITSKEENDFVKSLLKKHKYNAYWLGAKIDDTGFVWITGENFLYTDFSEYQPDCSEPGMVLQMWIQEDSVGWDDTWNFGDVGGGEREQGFICEWGEDDIVRKVFIDSINNAYEDLVTFSGDFREVFFKNVNSIDNANDGLLMLSALGATSTYSKIEHKNATDFLEECGFAEVRKIFSGYASGQGGTLKKIITGEKKSNKSSSEKNNDHGTIYCGYRDMSDGTRLFAFIISGYSEGDYEWISNFKLGKSSLHEGFDKASKELLIIAKQYISQFGGDENSKVWIMGHSRGAALTNLLAIKLVQNGIIENDNLYAYGFATPQYTTKEIPGFENSILNFVSPHDFVPCVAPTAWGYMRAGSSYEFKNEKKMRIYYRKYALEDYKGYTVKAKNRLINAFVKFGRDQETYVNGYTYKVIEVSTVLTGTTNKKVVPQKYGMLGIGRALSSGGKVAGVDYMLTTPNSGKVNALLVHDASLGKTDCGHGMIAYLSWIKANPVISDSQKIKNS